MARRIAAKQIGDTGQFTNSWLKMNTAPPEFGEAVSPCHAIALPHLAAPRPLAVPRLISLTAPPAPAPTSVDFLQMMTAADVVVSFASSLLLHNEDRRHLGWRVGCDRRLRIGRWRCPRQLDLPDWDQWFCIGLLHICGRR